LAGSVSFQAVYPEIHFSKYLRVEDVLHGIPEMSGTIRYL